MQIINLQKEISAVKVELHLPTAVRAGILVQVTSGHLITNGRFHLPKSVIKTCPLRKAALLLLPKFCMHSMSVYTCSNKCIQRIISYFFYDRCFSSRFEYSVSLGIAFVPGTRDL